MSDARREHDGRTTRIGRRPSPAGRYKIRLTRHHDARWATWFGGLRLAHERDGSTLIHGPVVDRAALHGLLQKVRDVGLPPISVIR